ncbi:MAG: primosomal protein N' [Bacilli bacterium]|nr:primosomal protein N' [Bacilli bacterium]
MKIDVLVEIKAKGIDQTFTYLVPKELEDKIKIGIRVLVPFGNKKLEGFILAFNKEEVAYKLKSIIDIVDEEPVLTEEMLKLGKYISEKTLCNLISAYQTMLPRALKAKSGFNINKKYLIYIKLIDKEYTSKVKKQQEIIELLKKSDMLKKDLMEVSASSVNTLLKKNVIIEEKREVYRLDEEDCKEESHIQLNSDQKKVVERVLECKDEFKPFLLYGVTGSGKTEVYMHIIEEIIKDDKEVIVLVPEISLTPQFVSHFKKRFGNMIAILHSGLNDGEKYDEWRKIINKDVKIAIGARSCIFAPLTNLGLIIIDEEHTDTYKQENNPKYNAIDIALKRAKTYHCPLVLGSATPSIESYTRAKSNIYELLTLDKRVNNTMPNVKLIDMKEEIRKGNNLFSEELKEGIKYCLDNHEQVILFLNRRGYSTVITCNNCGYTLKCPNCDIPLTYHKATNKMNCHYCDYTTSKLVKCPECGSNNINSLGLGTEKLEEEVTKEFGARVIRMDIDTTSKKGSHEKIITAFRKKEYDILIGTQMISKGLDFENVTLVGVINGDASLNVPDYRSSERTFALLNQVAGRSGRSKKKGKVIIQGFNIDHYSIIKASQHDYIGFYNEEMQIRKLLKYPPYYNLTLIRISGKDYNECYNESKKIYTYLANNIKDVIILGPSNSNMPKINNIYYMQIILKYKKTNLIINSLKFINSQYKKNNKINVDIDINPKNL